MESRGITGNRGGIQWILSNLKDDLPIYRTDDGVQPDRHDILL